MRFALFGLAGAVMMFGTSARAESYPWCAQYSGAMSGATNCGFVSLAQCMGTVSGAGGSCVQNPAYQPPAPKARKNKKSRS